MPRMKLIENALSSGPTPKILLFTSSDTFTTSDYTGDGYTKFDAIAIGAGGGNGGTVTVFGFVNDAWGIDWLYEKYGGAGGGGGIHRVNGNLSDIGPDQSITIESVAPDYHRGADGFYDLGTAAWVISPTNLSAGPHATDGTQGGASSFGDIAYASGGGGGYISDTTLSPIVDGAATFCAPGGNGGGGGVGASLTAIGSNGGVNSLPAVINADAYPVINPGGNGSWDGTIGSGGGGGGGGVYVNFEQEPPTYLLAGAGGNGGMGAYNAVDQSVYAAAMLGVTYNPGGGSGARTQPITGLPSSYGDAATANYAGVVAILLT